MYARLSSIMFPIATLLFIGALVWGYQEHQEKNAVLIKAENQYQRAFHDLSHHLGRLHDQLGQTLAVSSASHGMQRKGLVNVWRLTSEAQNEINQLPLAMLPFNKAEQFLSRISNFAYRTAVRDLTKQPLTPEELKTMKSLYKTSESINKELDKVQQSVIKDRLRWMDVEVAIASAQNSPHGNTIIDGFKAVDKQMGAYPENEWGPSAMSTDRKLSSAGLQGKDMGPQEIAHKAREFLGNQADGDLNVVEDGSNTDLPAYTVTAKGRDGSDIQMDYTRKGGHMLWFMNTRNVKSRKIDFDTARNKGSQFLLRHGYKNMTPITYDEYDHVAVFTYARTDNGVKIYPDKLTVRVALDNGEVVGMQATDHVFAQQTLIPGKPKIAKEKAQKGLNPDFKVDNYSLALIENEMREPTLCHEFRGRINGHAYKIFMNADTGLEETIEEIPGANKALFK
ncbi:germination protein YpeB [Paenibacillaceae bacterium WGS1546]|uniref:germination protein YpeB n=1 Tax=Cohnella sp. WGS1546 TaxID=3366810 RepID=UPI00372D28FA